jgi:hypothetical protein
MPNLPEYEHSTSALIFPDESCLRAQEYNTHVADRLNNEMRTEHFSDKRSCQRVDRQGITAIAGNSTNLLSWSKVDGANIFNSDLVDFHTIADHFNEQMLDANAFTAEFHTRQIHKWDGKPFEGFNLAIDLQDLIHRWGSGGREKWRNRLLKAKSGRNKLSTFAKCLEEFTNQLFKWKAVGETEEPWRDSLADLMKPEGRLEIQDRAFHGKQADRIRLAEAAIQEYAMILGNREQNEQRTAEYM